MSEDGEVRFEGPEPGAPLEMPEPLDKAAWVDYVVMDSSPQRPFEPAPVFVRFKSVDHDGEVWINPTQVASLESFSESPGQTRILDNGGRSHYVEGSPLEIVRKLQDA